MMGLESCIECKNFQKDPCCFDECINFSSFEPLEEDIIEFVDKAWEEAEYPRLVSKNPIVKNGTVSLTKKMRDDKYYCYHIERSFDDIEREKTRCFNNRGHMNTFLEIRYNGDEGPTTKPGTIDFELGYHHGKKRIHLDIIREFDNVCYGDMNFFETLKEVKRFLFFRYHKQIRIPKAAEQKLLKAEKKIKPIHRTIDEFTEAEN
jgi:hypothetical protein